MIKKTITYTDYNGRERTITPYFHLTEAELTKMQLSVKGGLDVQLQQIVDAADTPAIVEIIEDLIQRSYGVKTPDGGFLKRKEDLEAFMATDAYSKLFMELATDDIAAAEFIKGVLPASLADQFDAVEAKQLPAN